MKLSTNTRFEPQRYVTPDEAVTYVAHRAEQRCDDTLDRIRHRNEALESMLGRLIRALIDNRTLRADQVDAIFDYDVTVEREYDRGTRAMLDPNDPNNESRN